MIRNPIPWPNGARCAAAITFDMDADSSLHLNHPDTADTKLCATTMMRYDADVAMPRLIEVFKRFGLRQTFFVPGWCVERYSDAIKAAVDDGHEIGHHGYLHEKVNLLSDAQELQVLRLGIEAIQNATGRRPRGYRAPSYAFSKRTLSTSWTRGSITTPRCSAPTSRISSPTTRDRSSRSQSTRRWMTGHSSCASASSDTCCRSPRRPVQWRSSAPSLTRHGSMAACGWPCGIRSSAVGSHAATP